MLYAGGYDVFIARFADTLLADATPAMEMAADDVSITTYPNPLKDHLYIRIETPENGNATIDIRTVEGQRIGYKPVTLVSGKNEIYFEPGNISPGIYFVNISAVNFNSSIKIIVD